MIFLYGDESNTAGTDKMWAIGYLITSQPKIHMVAIQRLRRECSYATRELKYSSTDYSQVLCAIRIIDYFLQTPDLNFKILIKDSSQYNPAYFRDNFYNLDHKDMAYVTAYAELTQSIQPSLFGNHHMKLLNIDDKGFRGNIILPSFLKNKDKTIAHVYRRNSKLRKKDGTFTGVSQMIQLADFFTGTILSIISNQADASDSNKHKNIYRKAFLSRCNKIQEKLLSKKNYYWPNYKKQKLNVFYWKQCKKNASLSKSPS